METTTVKIFAPREGGFHITVDDPDQDIILFETDDAAKVQVHEGSRIHISVLTPVLDRDGQPVSF